MLYVILMCFLVSKHFGLFLPNLTLALKQISSAPKLQYCQFIFLLIINTVVRF